MGYIDHPDRFSSRHIGPDFSETSEMLSAVGVPTLEGFIGKIVPESIKISKPLGEISLSERDAVAKLRSIVSRNRVLRSHIGTGYHDVVLPPVIQRNILENPGWYTQYTPYQAEISQGRLEALLNFQTMICDLTGLEISNASLLDEATAAAEAMTMCYAIKEEPQDAAFFVSELCHPQTIELIKTRAWPLGISVVVGDHRKFDFSQKIFAALLQYPATDGVLYGYEAFISTLHDKNALAIVAADIFALTLVRPPGEFGADVAVGSTQRFGMPMGLGGPHAAYFATRDAFKRLMPGRIIGVSKDSAGKPALRLSLQTREQHIRREKATSNICTAQVLPAIVASMYAVYHGPKQLRTIAERMHDMARLLAAGTRRLFHKVESDHFFDTVKIILKGAESEQLVKKAADAGINLRAYDESTVIVALDETTGLQEVAELLLVLNDCNPLPFTVADLMQDTQKVDTIPYLRKTPYLAHQVFNKYHSETEMLRYIKHLESKDLSLTFSMIPLGSCTMKLNATSEMMPITWPELANIHPFVPDSQIEGYRQVFAELEGWLRNITGFSAVSLQPNSGAQGEYAGLLVIRRFYEEKGEGHRNICLIPSSAHGTNPASAAMAGFKVVIIKCDALGNIDVEDMRAKAVEHRDHLAACMITYPSTHGVFETEVKSLCQIVHENGGQVYMDGANMNAQVGLCKPGEIGADVCHLNLHKTFCIPHGGGGPGSGPIAVAEHLVPYLPGHPLVKVGGDAPIGPVSAAPWGSALIAAIPWMYISMMGGEGLTAATIYSILNANYIAKRLGDYYPILYKSPEGYVAHECILDCRSFKAFGIEVEDIAKRLMDYGFHSPTMSWPVPGTLMVEPTESESKDELDRFCDAMISIFHEIKQVENGQVDAKNNLLKNAPHTVYSVTSDKWDRPYAREQAAFPSEYTKIRKFWPAVGRVDNVYGDRNLFCSCPPIS